MRIKYRTGKFLAVMVCAAALCTWGGTASFAAEVSGPASDTEIAENSKEQAQPMGPGMESAQSAESSQPENGAQTEGGGQAGDTLQTEGGQTGGAAQTGDGAQTEGSSQEGDGAQGETAGQADGMVMSNGRLLDPSRPMVALTFDDGPYAPVGNRIMDCMEKYNGRGTFFVVGNRVNSFQEELRRMQAAGHEIANHSYSHKYLQKLGAEQIRNEVEGCNQAVAAVTGVSPALMRLPGGSYNAAVLANIHQPIILWNIDTRDWATKNAAQTAAAVIGKVKDGDIVLMHELYSSTAQAVEQIAPALTGQGFQLVTVSELIQFRGGAAPGVISYSFPPA